MDSFPKAVKVFNKENPYIIPYPIEKIILRELLRKG